MELEGAEGDKATAEVWVWQRMDIPARVDFSCLRRACEKYVRFWSLRECPGDHGVRNHQLVGETSTEMGRVLRKEG